MDAPLFYIPPLFQILCFFIGSAALLVPFLWLWHVRTSEEGGELKTLGQLAYTTMMRAFFLVVLFSLVRGLVVTEDVVLLPEIVFSVLMILGFVGHLYLQKRADFSIPFLWTASLYEIRRQLMLVLVILMIEILSFLTVFILVYGVMLLPGIGVNPLELAIFMVGVFWLGGLYLFFSKVQKLCPERFPEYFSYYKLLWPIVVGLLFFMLPLLLYDIAHSEKAREQLMRPPPLHGV